MLSRDYKVEKNWNLSSLGQGHVCLGLNLGPGNVIDDLEFINLDKNLSRAWEESLKPLISKLKGRTVEDALLLSLDDSLYNFPYEFLKTSLMEICDLDKNCINQKSYFAESLICRCHGIYKEELEKIIGDHQIKSLKSLLRFSDASSGCGSCKVDVRDVLKGFRRTFSRNIASALSKEPESFIPPSGTEDVIPKWDEKQKSSRIMNKTQAWWILELDKLLQEFSLDFSEATKDLELGVIEGNQIIFLSKDSGAWHRDFEKSFQEFVLTKTDQFFLISVHLKTILN